MDADPRPYDETLIGTDGRPVQLASFWAARPALLIFYPGDETAVCTKQLCEYRDRWSDFTAAGVAVVGINPAGAESHRAFAAHHRFPFPILSDPKGRCCAAFGARAWYGTRRLAVLVGTDGRERWRRATWPIVRPRAEELLRAVKEHLSSG
jgi:peroxiredoxin Q/BCP